jgi:hypothetical protein
LFAIGAITATILAGPAEAKFNPAANACRSISKAQIKKATKLPHVAITDDPAPKVEKEGFVFSECALVAYKGTNPKGHEALRMKRGELVSLAITLRGPEAGPNARYWNGEVPLPTTCAEVMPHTFSCFDLNFAKLIALREAPSIPPFPRVRLKPPPKLGGDRSGGYVEFLPNGVARVIEEWSSASSHVFVELKLYGARKLVVKQVEQLAKIVVPRLFSP